MNPNKITATQWNLLVACAALGLVYLFDVNPYSFVGRVVTLWAFGAMVAEVVAAFYYEYRREIEREGHAHM